eukprot:scaffold55040_cov18-Tisochrysis_lutea.AAC.1
MKGAVARSGGIEAPWVALCSRACATFTVCCYLFPEGGPRLTALDVKTWAGASDKASVVPWLSRPFKKIGAFWALEA